MDTRESVFAALAGLAARLGRFEATLLEEVYAAGDDAYCSELARRLSRVLGREVDMGQISRTLGSLKRLGLMVSEPRWPSTPQKHHRHRLVFSLTSEGNAVRLALHELSTAP